MSASNSKNTLDQEYDYINICRESHLRLLKIVESENHTMLLVEEETDDWVKESYIRCVDWVLFLENSFRWQKVMYSSFQSDTERVKLENPEWQNMWYYMLWENGEIVDDGIKLWSKSVTIKNKKGLKVELETEDWKTLWYYRLDENEAIITFKLGPRIGYLEKFSQNNPRQIFLKTEEGKKLDSYMLDEEGNIRTIKLWDQDVFVKRIKWRDDNIIELESKQWVVLWDYLFDKESDTVLSFEWWDEKLFAARYGAWWNQIDVKRFNGEEIARAILNKEGNALEVIQIWEQTVVTTSKWFLTEKYRHITLKNDRSGSPLHAFSYQENSNILRTIKYEWYMFTFDESSRSMYCFSQNLSKVDYRSVFDKETLKNISDQFKGIVAEREKVKKRSENIVDFKKQ